MHLPVPLRSFLIGLAGTLVLAALLELGLRTGRNRLPVYRRHLAIWSCAVLLGIAVGLLEGALLPTLVASTLGSSFGLALASLRFFWGRRLTGFAWQKGMDRRPDPERPLILVADAHWSEELTGLSEATLRHPEADWLFLGDIFDLWVGLPGMETEAQRSFLWWVRERRRLGRWVGFWMGNREYALDSLAHHFDLIGEGVGGELPAEDLCWEHGDLINDRDWKYRIWNLLSRSGIVWMIGRSLPSRWVRPRLEKLEKSMRTVNREYRLKFPREAFQAAAREHGQRAFITGHFHGFEVEANGTAIPWAHHGRYFLWHEGRVQELH
nr:hypothetical protein [uncultured Holophaga sp.]